MWRFRAICSARGSGSFCDMMRETTYLERVDIGYYDDPAQPSICDPGSVKGADYNDSMGAHT